MENTMKMYVTADEAAQILVLQQKLSCIDISK